MSGLNYFNYYTEVEAHFVKRRGKHLLISPLDWSLIEVWKESGIPLNVAIRGIDRAFEHYHARAVKPRLVNSLSYCHQEVLMAFEAHKEAYVGASPSERAGIDEDPAEKRNTLEADREKLRRYLTATLDELGKARDHSQAAGRLHAVEAMERTLGRLRELLQELSDPQLQAIPYESLERDLAILDKLLLDAVQGDVTPETRAVWLDEAKRELKMYKKNLPRETYERILENYISKRIHQHFDLPTLSLFFL